MASRNRGTPRPKLRDLSVHPLTNTEQSALLEAVAATTSPISTAILGAVLVEHELDSALRKRFRITDDKTWEEMVDERGILSSFSRKIMVGYAVRLYGAELRDNLNIIRAIRNAFAHSRRLINFDHPLVVREFQRLKIPKRQRKAWRKLSAMPPREAYVNLCYSVFIAILKKQTLALRRSSKRYQKKHLITSVFARTLAPALGLGGLQGLGTNMIQRFGLSALPESTPLWSPQNRTGGPTPLALSSLLRAATAKPPTNDDSGGK
jgi:hypothetical protein